jgi:ADP-ribose pyrophosphatase YjhB (NUDIX family)
MMSVPFNEFEESGEKAAGRLRLLAELAAYRPADEREREMLARLEKFVAGCADCFERTHLAGHVTGSAWVVDRSLRFALLTHHKKLGKWLQFGGHADGDDDVRRVALREGLEESGLAHLEFARDGIYDVDVHDIPARGDEPAHVHYDVRYAFFAERSDVPQVSDESHAVAWIALDALDALGVDASVKRLAAKSAGLSPRA